MAVRKYLNDSGLEHLSSYVNAKLTVVSTMPSASSELRTVLYIGETTEDYIQGGIYLYDETESKWILISTADVNLDYYETSWTGTLADWQALSSEEQAKYQIVNITDDFVPGTSDHVVQGYFYNEKFYEDAEHTTEIAGVVGFIYIDLPYDDLYLYDDTNSEFVLAGGGGIDSVVWGYYYEGDFYEEAAHTTIITPSEGYLYVDLDGNSIYIYKSNAYVQISGSSGNYTAGFGIKIDDNDVISITDFIGTQAEWDALSSTEKEAYDFIHITDDTNVVNEGAPGHAISDETSEKAQRTGLKFEGFAVTDDSTNDLTKIAEIPYTAGDGIEIDSNKEVTTDPDLLPFTFVGTKAEWEGLTTAEKANYKLVSLTDDVAGGDMVVEDAITKDSVNPVTSGAVYSLVNDISATSLSNTYNAYYSKIGKIVIVTFAINLGGGTPITTVTKIGQMPSDCIPYTEVTQVDAVRCEGRMSIDELGQVNILPMGDAASSYYFYGTIVYVAKAS